MGAAKGVLTGMEERPVSDLEISSAVRTIVARHQTDLQENDYWIALLTHLQYDNPKDTSCIRDVEKLFNGISRQDVQNAYGTLLTGPDQLFVSITTAGPG